MSFEQDGVAGVLNRIGLSGLKTGGTVVGVFNKMGLRAFRIGWGCRNLEQDGVAGVLNRMGLQEV